MAAAAEDAVTLVKANKVKYGFVWEGDAYEGGTCDFMEYYADTGGQVLNASDSASVLNVADVTKVLTFIRGLVTSGASPQAVDTFQEPKRPPPSKTGTPPSYATGITSTRPPRPRALTLLAKWELPRYRPLPVARRTRATPTSGAGTSTSTPIRRASALTPPSSTT